MLFSLVLPNELVDVDVFASLVPDHDLSVEVLHVDLASSKLVVVLTDLQKLHFAETFLFDLSQQDINYALPHLVYNHFLHHLLIST